MSRDLISRLRRLAPALSLTSFLLLAACATTPPSQSLPPAKSSSTATPQACTACQCPVCPGEEPAKPKVEPLQPAEWSELAGWGEDDLAAAWGAIQSSCRAMKNADWRPVCEASKSLGAKPDAAAIRGFLESRTRPWRITNPDGTTEGLITGYYEPLIKGSRTRSKAYATPVYGVPDDMVVVDLSELYPELKNMRLRGRIEGRKVVPYYSRAQIDARADKMADKVLLWAADPIDFFFLQVQGSGQVQLADGSRIRIAYADQNGHPYKSIGRWLVDSGEVKVENAGMEGIKAWARANPQRLDEMLDTNPSFVFFKEQPAASDGPNGALGVPLTAGRSVAIDNRNIPLGAPIFLSTTWPASDKPLSRLMVAQDTGGAIRGAVRADFYWGFGPEAGAQAGKMRSRGRMWLLWPRDTVPPGAPAP
ncbi:murein transglycosylase A [Niveibacterium sp. SC-1]|uniref:murein transglycosylase A n=1 Tax=Niveibacterium sp. SC-1 TaxID=3135646 RepID=UPI00311DCB43